jgi:hypothetical protein
MWNCATFLQVKYSRLMLGRRQSRVTDCRFMAVSKSTELDR